MHTENTLIRRLFGDTFPLEAEGEGCAAGCKDGFPGERQG